MNDKGIIIRLDDPGPVYYSGEVLSGSYRLTNDGPGDIQGVEASVMWHTEGKGDEDIGVHFFEKLSAQETERWCAGDERRFSTRLPRSPLSYDGLIVKILWCVRVRVFLCSRKEWIGEVPFQLGCVSRAREVF